MSLRFYFAPMSTASVTEAVLAELSVDCERIQLDISAGETRTAEYLKINPNGRVPTIVHDGTAIWESAAITMYLGETFGVAANLWPMPGPKRGEAMKWVTWCNVNLAEAGGRLAASLPTETEGAVQVNSQDWVPPEERTDFAINKAKADITTCLSVLDIGLEGKPYLLGNYSLVDTHIQGFVGWLTSMDVDLQAHQNVEAWLGRCGERPALAVQ